MPQLTIIVIGAGMAGLTAAIALRREGHHVTVLERSTFHQEAGAAIHVGSNISGFLEGLGLDFKRAGAIHCTGLIRFDGMTGELASKLAVEVIGTQWKNPYYQLLRPDFHEELRRVAFDAHGTSPTPELVLGARIKNVNVEAGTVKLEDGTTYTGDVIVGADGIHSITRLLVQPDAKPKPWHKSCYRWLTSRDKLLADPATKSLVEDDGYFGEMTGVDRRIIWYPCRKNKTINFIAFVPSNEVNAQGADFNQEGDKAPVRKAFGGFCEAAQKALEYADEDLKVWELYDMDVMPTWHEGKLVLIGDAAHPFLPFMGQGAAMAIEDAASLAAVLPTGTSAEEVSCRFKLYQECRHERGTMIQAASRKNGADLDKRDPDFDFGAAFQASQMYDEWAHSKQKLGEWAQRRIAVNEH